MTSAERRRELVEEIVHERSRAVVLVDGVEEPPPDSGQWAWGVVRLAYQARLSDTRRLCVRSIAVVALAWLEAVDGAE